MSYARSPALNAETYKRIIQLWTENLGDNGLPGIMTFTVPRRFLDSLTSYCDEKNLCRRADSARDSRYVKLTVYKPIATQA
jgi:hypothetical protein